MSEKLWRRVWLSNYFLNQMQIKILSWNIWCDNDFGQVKNFLLESKADIIGLQEILPGDKNRDIVSFLSSLGYEHAVAPIGATFPDGRMITSGIFSKYPIRERKAHLLSDESPRQAIEASVDVGDFRLTIFSFHLKHTHQQDSDLQNLQMENLMRVLPKKKVVVMGDFNSTPDMTPIKRMREIYIDTDSASTPTLNVPLFDCKVCDLKELPNTRLDYIFTSKDLTTHSFKVEPPHGSDHLPISVVVEL